MEKIKFDNLQGWRVGIITISAFLFILAGIFEPFNFGHSKIYKWISVLGYLLLVTFSSRMFWFKNYVQWNKKGIVIKLHSWIGVGKSIKFAEIKAINFIDDQIEFTLFGGRKKKVVNLHNIDLKDRQLLRQILQEQTRKK